MTDHHLPFVDFERGYFLDIKCFFPNKKLIGHKILSGSCNVNCYYCHRIDFLNKSYPLIPVGTILSKLKEQKYYNTIVVTGGEITLYYEAAIAIMKQLKKQNITTLFSSNGFYPDRIEKMLPFADVVKLDIKGPNELYKKISGKDFYNSAIESISIAAKKVNIEVKLILHQFTTQQHINSILEDIYRATGMPQNLAIEYQPVRDFLNIGLPEPKISEIMEMCLNARPCPEISLLKYYGEKERIYRKQGNDWIVFKEKEIPLRFNWNEKSTR